MNSKLQINRSSTPERNGIWIKETPPALTLASCINYFDEIFFLHFPPLLLYHGSFENFIGFSWGVNVVVTRLSPAPEKPVSILPFKNIQSMVIPCWYLANKIMSWSPCVVDSLEHYLKVKQFCLQQLQLDIIALHTHQRFDLLSPSKSLL